MGQNRERQQSQMRQAFKLTIQAEPGNYLAPPVKRLALLLKVMLRGYGFRCTDCRPAEEPPRLSSQAAGPEATTEMNLHRAAHDR